MYDKYDQGVQASLGKLRNLLVCAVVAKSQEDRSVSEAKCRQKKRSASYGNIHC